MVTRSRLSVSVTRISSSHTCDSPSCAKTRPFWNRLSISSLMSVFTTGPRAVGFTIVWPEGVIFSSMMTYHVQFLLLVLAGWVNRQQQDVIDYLQEENRVLRAGLRGKPSCPKTQTNSRLARRAVSIVINRRCCTARSKSLTSLCRLQSHPAQYVSGIPSAAILLSISHPIRCSTRCLANVRARISGPMIAL